MNIEIGKLYRIKSQSLLGRGILVKVTRFSQGMVVCQNAVNGETYMTYPSELVEVVIQEEA